MNLRMNPLDCFMVVILPGRTCAAFAANTDQVTEFRDLSWRNWKCYVVTRNGERVPLDSFQPRQYG